MALDFTDFFARYEAIQAQVDDVFAKFQKDVPELVTCSQGCCDCCYALFDLTLIEALYVNHHFNKKFSGVERSNIQERADRADREVYRLKRKFYRASESGINATEILKEAASQRVRCPLLGEDDLCVLYDNRPITCRVYGVPTVIGEEAHTCAKSGFKPGEQYPTVKMNAIQESLFALSHEVARSINTRYRELGDMLVPTSMALLNDYDENYLGARKAPETPSAACSTCSEDSSACASCAEKSFDITLGGHEKEEE